LLHRLAATAAGTFALIYLHAQQYELSFGGFVNDEAYSICPMNDTGFVTGGLTSSFVAGSNLEDVYVTPVARAGDIMGSKQYDVGQSGSALSVHEANNGGVLVCGSNNHTSGFYFKTDPSGAPLWGRRSASLKKYNAIDTASNGDVLVTGITTGTDQDIQVE